MANSRLPKGIGYDNAGADAHGRMLDKPPPNRRWEVCSVWDYSPQAYTYTIISGLSGRMSGIRRLITDPGEISVLPRGTEVVIHFELGYPVIAAVLKSGATNATEVNPARISEIRGVGGEDGVYAPSHSSPVSNVRAPNDPVDVISGDWVRKGVDNNMVGVLSGGTNIMSSSPMAQIRTHKVNDMVEVMANLYRHISCIGNLEIINDGGKTSLTWRAGADQLSENGANAENWTLRLDAGAEGDLFRFSVTTPHNNTLCELHMSADGRLSLTGVAGVDISSGARGTAREDVGENKEVVVQGTFATTVQGAVTEKFGASKETIAATNITTSAGNDLKETVGHNRMTHISNNLVTTVDGGGLAPPPAPGHIAVLWDIVNGGTETVTGSPKSGGLPLKQPQNFVNYGGGFNMVIQPTAAGGKFTLVSNEPDSVLLGASGSAIPGTDGHTVIAIAAEHTMKYEPFEAMMGTLLTWLDSHTHLSAMGPTGPAAAAPTGPVTPQVKPVLVPIKSMRVLVGG